MLLAETFGFQDLFFNNNFLTSVTFSYFTKENTLTDQKFYPQLKVMSNV